MSVIASFQKCPHRGSGIYCIGTSVVVGILYDFQCVSFQQSKHQTSSENPLQSTNRSRVPMTKLMPTSENDVEAASQNTGVKSNANHDGIV